MDQTMDQTRDACNATLKRPGVVDWQGWGNVQHPTQFKLATGQESPPIYGQVWAPGVTDQAGDAVTLSAEVVVGPYGAMPGDGACFTTTRAEYHLDVGNNNEYKAKVLAPRSPGLYGYLYRYRLNDGTWRYAGVGGTDAPFSTEQAGVMTVTGSTPERLRLLSLNLQCLQNDWPARKARIISMITELEPDVLVLQEDCIDGAEAQSHQLQRALASSLGRGFVRLRQTTHVAGSVGAMVEEGISLLTAFPIDSHHVLELPHRHFPRKAIAATLEVGNRRIRVYSTHFDYSAQASTQRLESAKMILSDMANAPNMDHILAGDLNATPTREEIQYLTGTLTDTWKAANPNDEGYTYPSSGASRRIDYVLTSDGLSPFSAQTVGGAERVSDHLGVFVTLTL